MRRCGLAIIALFALTAEASPPLTMPQSGIPQALSLRVEHLDGRVAVELNGLAARATKVSYLLEVTGRSNSRHRGSTTLAANVPARLSTMTMDADAQWCVHLTAEEEGRDPYELREGNCSAES